ncbi:Calcium/calmodulin-dependent protein kinase type 1 [Chlorella vulgaris]
MGACCSVFDAPIDKTVYPEGGKKLRTDVAVEDVYRMGPQIGEGAYSKVRLATHRETGQHFACKIVPLPNPNQASNEHMSSRASIMREVDALLDIEHRSVGGMLEYYRQGNRMYLIMQLLRGGELTDALREQASGRGAGSERVIVCCSICPCQWWEREGEGGEVQRPQPLFASGSTVLLLATSGWGCKMQGGCASTQRRGADSPSSLVVQSHYSEADARTIFRQLIQAIQYLHSRGVVHRDIKLKNLLLFEPGDLNHVKLADFGLSAKARQGQPHHMQTVCGTPGFVAPEVLRGLLHPHDFPPKRYGPACDLWSAGVVLFLLLSGVPPFSDPSEPRLMRAIAGGKYSFDDPAWEEVSKEAKELVSQLLVVDPSKRMTCEQVLAHPWMTAAPGGEAELQQARARLVAAHTRGGSKPLSDRIKAAIYRSEEAARAAAVKAAAAAAAPPPADSLPAAST